MSKNAPKLSMEARKLLELVPAGDEFIGNTTLIRRSGLGKKYWAVRKELLAGGFLTRGKGRGGSVGRVAADIEAPSVVGKKGKLYVSKESELYGPLKGWLDDVWGADITGGDFLKPVLPHLPKEERKVAESTLGLM